MSERALFALGVVVGAIGVTLLFVRPASTFLCLQLFCWSSILTARRPASDSERTKDVSTQALLGIAGAAALFLLFLIPTYDWRWLDSITPQRSRAAGDNTSPLWVRFALAALWIVVMFRDFKKLTARAKQVA